MNSNTRPKRTIKKTPKVKENEDTEAEIKRRLPDTEKPDFSQHFGTDVSRFTAMTAHLSTRDKTGLTVKHKEELVKAPFLENTRFASSIKGLFPDESFGDFVQKRFLSKDAKQHDSRDNPEEARYGGALFSATYVNWAKKPQGYKRGVTRRPLSPSETNSVKGHTIPDFLQRQNGYKTVNIPAKANSVIDATEEKFIIKNKGKSMAHVRLDTQYHSSIGVVTDTGVDGEDRFLLNAVTYQRKGFDLEQSKATFESARSLLKGRKDASYEPEIKKVVKKKNYTDSNGGNSFGQQQQIQRNNTYGNLQNQLTSPQASLFQQMNQRLMSNFTQNNNGPFQQGQFQMMQRQQGNQLLQQAGQNTTNSHPSAMIPEIQNSARQPTWSMNQPSFPGQQNQAQQRNQQSRTGFNKLPDFKFK